MLERGDLTARIYAVPLITGVDDQLKIGIRHAFGDPQLRTRWPARMKRRIGRIWQTQNLPSMQDFLATHPDPGRSAQLEDLRKQLESGTK